MKLQYFQMETPVGDFIMIIKNNDNEAVVFVSGFGRLNELQKRLPQESLSLDLEKVNIHEYEKLIDAYFKGDLNALNNIPCEQNGSDFYKSVWSAMSSIKPGKTMSYKELALDSGNPLAIRAAGSACARNKLILLVPCHRVVKSDGSTGNYLYGSDIKKYLLEHEGVFSSRLSSLCV